MQAQRAVGRFTDLEKGEQTASGLHFSGSRPLLDVHRPVALCTGGNPILCKVLGFGLPVF